MFLSTAIDYVHGLLVERCKAQDNDRGARMAVASPPSCSTWPCCCSSSTGTSWLPSLQAVGLTFMPVLNIHLPIGISFYTFQTMSYTIDVYRGDTGLSGPSSTSGTFVTLFPS